MARNEHLKVVVTERGARAAFRMLAPVTSSAAKNIGNRIPARYQVGVRDEVNRSGRPTSLVTLMEVNALAIQAKHGTVTRAAAEEGAEITRYPPSGGR
ncbi:MAG: hypothetical protein ACI38U_03165 [Corynebacterium sp.]|uniref:hypothetical protein n=1 Tax=Corynebacterium sp. TaxID=1720 RepID=UPI003F05BE1C